MTFSGLSDIMLSTLHQEEYCDSHLAYTYDGACGLVSLARHADLLHVANKIT